MYFLIKKYMVNIGEKNEYTFFRRESATKMNKKKCKLKRAIKSQCMQLQICSMH